MGSLVILDNDEVALSNCNRQLPALHSTCGQSKVGCSKHLTPSPLIACPLCGPLCWPLRWTLQTFANLLAPKLPPWMRVAALACLAT